MQSSVSYQTSRDVYDWILLQCMAFNVISLIFGFLLTSLALLFEHHQVHSNSHTGLTHLNILGSYVGLVIALNRDIQVNK